jgi:hypothetical protein
MIKGKKIMPAKPNARHWNDVQTAIATAAIVTTIGLWNLFATPAKTVTAQAPEPTDPSVSPPTEPPVASEAPASMPQVKIMFTQVAPQTVTVAAAQPQQQPQLQVKKKKKNNNNGGSQSVTQTKTS